MPLNIWKNISDLRKKQLGLIFLLNIASGISEAYSLIVVMPFLDLLTSSKKDLVLPNIPLIKTLIKSFLSVNENNQLMITSILVAKVIIITSVIRITNLYFNYRFSALIGTDISAKLFDKTLSKPYIWHINTNSSSSISSTIFQTDQLVAGIKALMLAATSLVVTIFLSISLFLIDYRVTLYCLVFASVSYITISYFNKKSLFYNSRTIIENDKLRLKILKEGYGNIRDIILYKSQNYFIKKFKRANSKTRLSSSNNQFLSSYPRFALESIVIVLIVFVAYTLQVKQGSGSSFLTVLGIFALALQRLLPSIQQIYNGFIIVKGNLASIYSVIDQLNEKIENKILSNNKLNLFNYLVLKNVYFNYQNKTKYILKNINLKIKKGEKIGLIGKTGSGKTTLINILMGLVEPSKGEIKVNNLSIFNKKNKFEWKKFVAHVPQDIYLSDNTIAENIAFGIEKKYIDMQRVIEAAKKSQLHDFIISKKLTYETTIGEMGIQLSGGQRQRLAIARALYKDLKFLVFDEATSALDSQCEKFLMDEIYKLHDLTIILVAHRLTTLSKCDKIIDLENGEIKKIYEEEEIKKIINRK